MKRMCLGIVLIAGLTACSSAVLPAIGILPAVSGRLNDIKFSDPSIFENSISAQIELHNRAGSALSLESIKCDFQIDDEAIGNATYEQPSTIEAGGTQIFAVKAYPSNQGLLERLRQKINVGQYRYMLKCLLTVGEANQKRQIPLEIADVHNEPEPIKFDRKAIDPDEFNFSGQSPAIEPSSGELGGQSADPLQGLAKP